MCEQLLILTSCATLSLIPNPVETPNKLVINLLQMNHLGVYWQTQVTLKFDLAAHVGPGLEIYVCLIAVFCEILTASQISS